MSVLIKGVEMPSGCAKCPLADDEARFCKAANEYIPMLGKPAFCPLEESPAGNEWIPCSDRLPEKSGLYLVTTPFDSMAPVCSRYFNKRGEQSFWSGHPMNEVVAWQPMPEPWKGEE